MILIAGIFEVILWILVIMIALGALAGVLAFVGLRKLWRFVTGAFEDDGRQGPGDPPLSRRKRSIEPASPVEDLSTSNRS